MEPFFDNILNWSKYGTIKTFNQVRNKINHEIARMVNKQLDKLVRDISGMSMPATPRKSRQIGNRSRSENR